MCEACIASAISTRFAELTVPLTFLPTSIDAQSSTAIRARAAAAQNRNVGVRALEQQEFIFRDYKPTIPPAVTYGITKRMKDIQKVLSELEELGKKWQQEDHRAQSKHKEPKKPTRRAGCQYYLDKKNP